MSLQALMGALERFERAGGDVLAKDATDPDGIVRVSEALDLKLPESFREFYSTYEYLEYGPEELLPLRRIAARYEVFHDVFPRLPRSFLPFMVDDSGGTYVVVCQEEGDREPSSEFGCILYIPGCQPPETEFKGGDITAFLVSRIEERTDNL